MNNSTYIFGELSNGYSQYPDDSSSNLFRDIQDQCVAPSQLIIHRDENMMYYIYIRKFDKNKCIGFAIAINGYYFTQFQPLFSLFEKEIEELVEIGVILNFSNDGEITSKLQSLRDEEEEVLSILNSLLIKTNTLNNFEKLPPIDFSVAITSRKLFKITDADSEIANSSYRFGFTFVFKESDYDTIRTTSYRNTLKNLYAKNEALSKRNEELNESNKKIRQQKKQFKNIVLLILVVIACGICLYILNKNLNTTQGQLNLANNTISEKEFIINNKDSIISNLRDSIKSIKWELFREVRAKERVESSLQNICTYTPIIITNCVINASQFQFEYFSLEEKEITIGLRAVNEKKNEVIYSNHTIILHKGNSSISLDFYRRLDPSQYYLVVLMYDGHVIAGKRW